MSLPHKYVVMIPSRAEIKRQLCRQVFWLLADIISRLLT